jgi:nicotinamidase-related amidase
VYPDAFAVAELDRRLAGLGRDTVVLIGGYAARCVLATAFGAQRHGYHVVVPRGLAEPHPRHVEEEAVSLAVIDSIVGYVVEPEVVAKSWRRTGASRLQTPEAGI